jgi:HAD superfamily hydrolase (TIGR01509 family)
MIKAIIFDLNGIFIQSPKLSDRIAKDFGISPDIFLPKLSEIMNKVRQPEAGPSFNYWEPVLKEWNINLSEQEFWKYWFEVEVPSERMISFVKELKNRGIRIFILSNNFKERAEYYGHYPWMHEIIDKAYFSWQTGFVKPDKKAWELILSENNLQPEECLYFDDQEKNIKASEETGVKAYMFTNEEELGKIINKNIL